MITYHLIDSITLMKALEIIDQHNWNQTTDAQATKQEPCEQSSLVLKALRNSLSNPVPLEPPTNLEQTCRT